MFAYSSFLSRHGRRTIAIGAIAISVLAAIALAGASSPSTSIWIARHPLAPGAVLTSGDIARQDATLGSSQKNYYLSNARIVGNVVTRPIGSFEFIPLNALAQAGQSSDFRQLPIGVAKSDLPTDLGPGDRVDLYSIPKDAGKGTELVATGIRVQEVDNKSRDLGGAVTVLFLLHEREILPIMDSLTSGRIVVVRNAL